MALPVIRIMCRTCGGEGAVGHYSPDPEWNDRETCPGCDGECYQLVDELGPDDVEFVVTGVGTMTISMDDDDPDAPF